MSGIVAEKLYPPTIGSTIPAFYVENGTAIIAVPFSMNRAVDANSVGGFRLKIKTIQNNTLIKLLDIPAATVNNALTSRIAKFSWKALDTNNQMTTEFNKIKLGQFLKVQLAYIDKSGNVGYFSTVAMTKYTSKPFVYIENASYDEEDKYAIPLFKSSYIGVYQTTDDVSERPYSYCFYLYNKAHGLVESSGWKLHNASVNNVASESLVLDKTIDTYTFTEPLIDEEEYYIQYGVKTINNLEVYSMLYPCCVLGIAEPEIDVELIAENNFDEAFIELHFELNDNSLTGALEEPISIEVSRANKLQNYLDWKPIKKAFFRTYEDVARWKFKDFTIEQGMNYKYSFRQYNHNYLYSGRKESNVCQSDFEDMFLWDGKKQLKIKFNPKISSFKATKSEQKMETIGSKYPYIFKNGIIDYKEFPISGLITYVADNHEMFVDYEDELDIVIPEEYVRSQSPEDNDYVEQWNNDFSTTKMTGYNMRAERIFKMKTLEWLNNGEIKMFKSAAEGNYLVRLINVSLTPEDRLGRMLHTVQCTAYEVEELTYANLVSLGFIKTDEPVEIKENAISSIYIADRLTANSANLTSVKLNEFNITGHLSIIPSPHTEVSQTAFYIRIGEDNAQNKVYISNPFTLDAEGAVLPDIYFNYNDNLELMGGTPASLAKARTLVGTAIIEYNYSGEVVGYGGVYHIDKILVKNQIETFIGPKVITFGNSDMTDVSTYSNNEPAILKFYVLEFITKQCQTKLIRKNGKYYDYDHQNVEISIFDPTQIYQVAQSILSENKQVGLYYANLEGNNLIQANVAAATDFYTLDNDENTGVYPIIDQSVILRATLDSDNQREVVLQVPTSVDLNTAADFNEIEIGWGIYLKTAYQERTVIYEQNNNNG